MKNAASPWAAAFCFGAVPIGLRRPAVALAPTPFCTLPSARSLLHAPFCTLPSARSLLPPAPSTIASPLRQSTRPRRNALPLPLPLALPCHADADADADADAGKHPMLTDQ
ncbi:hypothetical protein [Cupriavidus pauculus]|uniref:hypothetical protein n=1 Tax=Cupriavidus pauculus TaxID=82633 RepID=UPI0038572DD5